LSRRTPFSVIQLRILNGSSCPEAVIHGSIEGRVRRVSKLPFVAPPFLHWSAEVY
jgi:hypothetical protein